MNAACLTSALDRALARDRLAGREPERDAGDDRRRAAIARLGGRPAARLHAPVQHHRLQPAGRARRRPAARQRLPPGGPEAAALHQAASGLRPRRGPDRQGPRTGSSTPPGQQQRPDRADPACRTRWPQIGVGPVTRNGASRQGALPGLRQARCGNSLDPALHPPGLQPRAHRLVRRLRPLRLPGCLRRHRPDLDHPQRVHPRRPRPARSAVPAPILADLCNVLSPPSSSSSLGIKNLQRCPGANERGLSDDQLTTGRRRVDCDPTQTPVGP